jgi:hypothetical protein
VINHIDVSMVLRGTVCDLYSNLVTRSTGAAVRGEIEAQLAELRGRSVNVIDFSHVTLLDFSCADEIVAKLLLRFGVGAGDDATTRTAETPCAVADDWNGTPAPAGPREAYFVFRGVSDVHRDAIETVLERHRLALVAEGDDGVPELVGAVEEPEQRVWQALVRVPRADAEEVARLAGLRAEEAEEVLDRLCRRRLVIRVASDAGDADCFLAVGAR